MYMITSVLTIALALMMGLATIFISDMSLWENKLIVGVTLVFSITVIIHIIMKWKELN